MFTAKDKLLLPDSEAEIVSVICTIIKNRDSDHYYY